MAISDPEERRRRRYSAASMCMKAIQFDCPRCEAPKGVWCRTRTRAFLKLPVMERPLSEWICAQRWQLVDTPGMKPMEGPSE